ncbi:BON domain-containing protein [Planctomicrobium sp. SH527]|uniref:BON domain-containing protein n=1 Tax=Planctomicrobium sp. SH527 TaxID=3448123 RepID=UPI003F5C9107
MKSKTIIGSGARDEVSAQLDAELRLHVIDRLADLGETMRLSVHVQVLGQVVTLTGTVDSSYHRLLLVSIVSRIAGVERVVDRITLGSRFHRLQVDPDTQKRLSGHWSQSPLFLASSAAGIVFALVASVWFSGALISAAFGQPLQSLPLIVQFDGKPAEGAVLTLHPQLTSSKSTTVLGVVNARGEVEWTTHNQGDGVLPGNYRMTATWRPLIKTRDSVFRGNNVLSKDLMEPSLSPFEFVVTAADQQPQMINLKR